ncbi:hypothetical protein CLU79DRAFT_730198 [Phycomyces nitens]|nr:hypothetical protein CLU79DRAFT_730198 [Phycomyces nitens]
MINISFINCCRIVESNNQHNCSPFSRHVCSLISDILTLQETHKDTDTLQQAFHVQVQVSSSPSFLFPLLILFFLPWTLNIGHGCLFF